MNRAEALDEEARYIKLGHTPVRSRSNADIIVIRGCSVTGRAQHDCEKFISGIKRKYPTKKIIVKGCLPARLVTPGQEREAEPAKDDPVPTSSARAYLKVQDGCNCRCSFCTIPLFRGNSRSYDKDNVLDRASRFIDAGYREIVVTGCNLSQYVSGTSRLPELLSELAEISSGCRIRLGSLEPSDCGADVVDVMAEKKNICRFLHLSVQSASNNILTAMGRKYTARELSSLCTAAAGKIPGISLGADIICGFPGERDIDFTATEYFIRSHPFTNVHAFPYSERPGTKAAMLPFQVPRHERSERARRISEIVTRARRKYASSMIGREVEIIIENEARQSGWTGEYLWLEASLHDTGKTSPKRRELVKFRVLGTDGEKLTGARVVDGGRNR